MDIITLVIGIFFNLGISYIGIWSMRRQQEQSRNYIERPQGQPVIVYIASNQFFDQRERPDS